MVERIDVHISNKKITTKLSIINYENDYILVLLQCVYKFLYNYSFFLNLSF